MATDPFGIAAINTNTKTYLDTLAGLRNTAGPIQHNTDMDAVRRRQAEYANYLGQTDYDQQLEESRDQAKLQFYLNMAQRGFAAAGAAPLQGESLVSTLSRELLSPLAGDAGTVAEGMIKKNRAINAAKTAEERQLKLAALQKAEDDNARLEDLAFKLMPKPATGSGLLEAPYYVIQEGPDGGWSFVPQDGGLGQVQVRQRKLDGAPFNIHTLKSHPLKPGQMIVRPSDLSKFGLGEPTEAVTTKGLDDPKFKASFRGMVAQMGRVQELQGLGRVAIRFDPVKFANNPELEPGANFPFDRLVGVNQSDGSVVLAPLEEDQQKTYADNLRAGYLNIFDAIKTGEEPANLNSTFIARELRKSLGALGILAAGVPAGVRRGREQITNPAEITAAYVGAVSGFATDVQGTLDNLPFGVDNSNLSTGTGKLVLYNEFGVDFGPSTVSPVPIAPDSNAAAVGERAASIRELDAGSIQERILAENASKGTSMGSELRTSTADSRAKQLAVVGEQLKAAKARLAKAMSSPGAAKDRQVLEKSLEMLTRLQKLDYDLKQSGITGFIIGPMEGVLQKYLGIDVGQHFRSDEGQKAAARFIQSLPVTQQLFARDILRQAGEQRFTNKDLEGAQDTLATLGRSGEFNAGALRQLTGYLKSIVKSGLSNAGTFDISPATLEKAAMLGIDLKSITPKNNYYNPYFNQGKYAVTNQPIPQYSKQYMDGLRDNGIFGYAAMRGTTGGAPMYRLIDVDRSTGLPIPVDSQDLKKGFKTTVVSGAGDWKAALGSEKKKMLDFNRNYLLKTYGLDK